MPTEDRSIDPELKAVESRLAALAPAAAHIDRDQLMYAAGRASAARTAGHVNRALAVAAAMLLMTTVGLSIDRVRSNGAPVAERPPTTSTPKASAPVHSRDADRPESDAHGNPFLADAATTPRPSTAPLAMLSLRRRVLVDGLDAWPERPLPDSRAPTEFDREAPQPTLRAWSRGEWNDL